MKHSEYRSLTGPRPYTIRYLKDDNGVWFRETLAFLCFCQWQQRNHYQGRGNKPLPPRNYRVWPLYYNVGSLLKEEL